MAKNRKINVQGKEITIIGDEGREYISLTDMLKEPLIKARDCQRSVQAEHLTAVPATFSKIAVSYGYTATYRKIEDLQDGTD